MSRKSKLLRFAELDSFANSFQGIDPNSSEVRIHDGTTAVLQNHWNTSYFKNHHPLTLELACGKGEYTVALAQEHPERNFIGIDIKGNRMHRGAKKALHFNLTNAAFLRIRIEWLLNHFGPGEISEIWITFPDPFLKNSKANRRLTSPMFLDKYKTLLKPGGTVHLKTDSDELYAYSLGTIQDYKGIKIKMNSADIDGDGLTKEDLALQTYYEGQHRAMGKKIKYLAWQFD